VAPGGGAARVLFARYRAPGRGLALAGWTQNFSQLRTAVRRGWRDPGSPKRVCCPTASGKNAQNSMEGISSGSTNPKAFWSRNVERIFKPAQAQAS